MQRTNLLVVFLLLLGGCALVHEPVGEGGAVDSPTSGAYDPTVRDTDIGQAALAGSMSTIGEFDADVYLVEPSPGGAIVALHAGRQGGADFGWAMLRVETSVLSGFRGVEFAPGAVHTLEGGLISGLGCTGPAPHNFDFDGHADRMELRVEEGPTPGSRLFLVHAEFDGEGYTDASFVLGPR